MRSLIFLLLVVIAFMQCGGPKEQSKTILFNGTDLTGWDTYLGPTFDTVQNKFDTLVVPGLNKDPNQVFTVVQEDGQPAIRLSGNGFGAISTKDEFENYHLTLQFKWGRLKWPNRLDKPRDSGIIFHSEGPFGAAARNWMIGHECQVQENDCGDYWPIGDTSTDIFAGGSEPDQYYYDPNGIPITFGFEAKDAGRRCRKSVDGEKPSGEWNTIELYSISDKAVFVVNGVVNNELFNLRKSVGGTSTPMTRGKIQLQVEGAELFYRNIEVEQIDDFPVSLPGLRIKRSQTQ